MKVAKDCERFPEAMAAIVAIAAAAVLLPARLHKGRLQSGAKEAKTRVVAHAIINILEI